MARKKPKVHPLKPGAIVAGLIRLSDVKYPIGCNTPEQRLDFDTREIDKRKGIIRESAGADGKIIDEWFVDWDISGQGYAVEKRDAYIKLCVLIDDCMVSDVYADALSRVIRSPELTWVFLNRCDSHSTIAHVPDLGDYHSASGRLMTTVKAAFNQYEAEIASERVRQKMAQAVKMGQMSSVTDPPRGYVYDKLNRRVILDSQAKVDEANQIFLDAIRHQANLTGLAQEYNKRLASGDAFCPRPVRSRIWHKRSLLTMLTSPSYRRRCKWGELEFDAPDRVPECVPADIVAMFDNFLTLRSNKWREEVGFDRLTSARHVYAGILWCAKCGRPMHAHWHSKLDNLSYRCRSALPIFGQLCDAQTVYHTRLDRLVASALRIMIEHLIAEYPGAEQSLRRVSAQRSRGGGVVRDKDSLRSRLDELWESRKRAIHLAISGAIDEKSIREVLDEIDGEAAQIRQIVHVADRPVQKVALADLRTIAARVEDSFADGADDASRRALLMALQVRVYAAISPDGSRRLVRKNYFKNAGTLQVRVESLLLGMIQDSAISVSEGTLEIS